MLCSLLPSWVWLLFHILYPSRTHVHDCPPSSMSLLPNSPSCAPMPAPIFTSFPLPLLSVQLSGNPASPVPASPVKGTRGHFLSLSWWQQMSSFIIKWPSFQWCFPPASSDRQRALVTTSYLTSSGLNGGLGFQGPTTSPVIEHGFIDPEMDRNIASVHSASQGTRIHPQSYF